VTELLGFFAGVLRFRLLILAAAAAVMAVGFVQLRGAPVDVLPEFTPPYAEIQTEALGLSAEEVEQLITVPLEADLLNGVEGVDIIRSESVPGLSSIVLVFARGTDVYRARQLVEERLTQAHALPNVSKPPTMLQPMSSSSRVLMIGLSTTALTPIEQSVIARWTVRPRLMGVPGVANVSVWGMRDQQLQVQVDPEELRDKKVTLAQVINTTGNSQVVSQLSFLEASTPGTGGFIETPQQRLQVRHLLEKLANPAELAKVPVEGTGGRLKLGDISNIKVDHQPLIGDAVVSGAPGLLLVVEKFPGASTPEVTEGVEKALNTLRPGLQGITIDTSLFRPADYVDSAQRNIGFALLIGGALMLLALLALGLNWRTVVIAAVTIPVSLLASALVLRLLGESINALVFAGIAAGAAIVVDEAVSPATEMTRRLREGSSAGTLAHLTQLGSSAIRVPLFYAAAVALLAIVPLAVLDGRPGAFFRPLVLAYVLATVAAGVVAMTVTPALTSLLFKGWRPASKSTWLDRAGDRYERTLERFRRGLAPALLVAAGCVVIVAATIPFLTTSLVPGFQDRNVLIRLEGQPGTSNQAMTERATQLSRLLTDLPGVAAVGAHVGRAVTGDRVVNVNSSDVWVAVEPDVDYEDTMELINQAAVSVSGVSAQVTPYTAQKLRDVGALKSGANLVTSGGLDVLTGLDTPIAVRLYGQDSKILAQQAAVVKDLMSKVEGVAEPRVQTQPTQQNVEIEVDLEKAQQFGISPGAVRRAEATLLQGIQVGSVFEQQRVFDVIVQGVPETRRSLADIRNLLIDRPGGGHVRLGQVADVRIAEAPSSIQRDAVSRRLDIVADVDGRSVSDIAADIEAALAKVSFPMEYHAEVLRSSTAEEVGSGRVIGVAIAAAIAAFLLFQAAFRSWRLALVVFASLPLSLAGGLGMVLVEGGRLSLGAILGLVAILGLAARFAVLLVSTVQSHLGSHGEQDVGLAVQQAARKRLRPVIASSVALAVLVLPAVILGDRPGLEILRPLALVLLGGLVTTAVVSLLVVPALYGVFAPPRPAVPMGSPAWAAAMAPNGKSGNGEAEHSGRGQQHTAQPASVGSDEDASR
jgi:Cu/Ag efflux pump CusA